MTISEKKIDVSVIIPCFNQGRFLGESIESVIDQTFRDFEIIIVNDGSTEEHTLKILAELEKKYPNFSIIHQENRGLAGARNAGIKASKGEFFLPLDADDTIEPTMLEKCHEEITKNQKLGMVYSWVHFFGNDESIWENSGYNFYDLLSANQLTACALVRKKAWEEVGGYDEKMKYGYEDWEFWIRLGKSDWFGKLVKEPLFNYRRHGESMISGSELKHYEIVKYIRTKHKGLYSKESLKKIKAIWKPHGNDNIFKTAREKLSGAGIGDAELWKKHPLTALGRCVPIRIKRKVNSLFKKRIFDTSYYRRSGG